MTVSMRVAIALSVSTAVLAAGPGLQAQTPTTYRFKEGETLNYVLTIATKNTLKSMDKEATIIQRQVIDMSWNVLSVDATGNAKIKLNYRRAKLIVENGKESREGSSDAKDDPDEEIARAMTALARGLAKLEATLTITARGDVQSVSISPAALKEMKALLGADKVSDGWTDANLQTTLKDNMLLLTGVPLAKGTTWKAKVLGASPYGKVTGETEYVCDGPVERGGGKVEKLLTRPKLKIETDPKATPPVTIKMFEVDGAAYFDAAHGRLVETSSIQHIEAQAEVMDNTYSYKTEVATSLKLVPKAAK